MIEVGVRHHLDSDSPVRPVVYRITDNTQHAAHGLRGHRCSLLCVPVFIEDEEAET